MSATAKTNKTLQNVVIQLRNDTAANWGSSAYILKKGELGLDTTNNVIKIGDGTSAWSALPNAGSVIAEASAYDATTNPGGKDAEHGGLKVNGTDINVFTLLAGTTAALGGVKSAADGTVKNAVTIDGNGLMSVQYVDYADALKTARTISISSDATGSATFDGSANADIALTLADTGVTANNNPLGSNPYFAVRVDSKGRVTAGQVASEVKATDSALGLVQGHVKDTTTPANNIDKVFVDADGKLSIEEASKAAQLTTARTISTSGDATGSASFDGTTNVDIALTLADSGVTAGAYDVANVTVDSKGRVTAISAEPTTTTGGTAADASKLVRLGADGKLDDSIIPALAIGEVRDYASVAAMDAGVATDGVQSGDVAVVTNTTTPTEDGVYIYTGSAYVLIKVPGTAIQTVNGKTGPTVVLTTDDVSEGSTNLYFTTARVSAFTTTQNVETMFANGDAIVLDTDTLTIQCGGATA